MAVIIENSSLFPDHMSAGKARVFINENKDARSRQLAAKDGFL